MNKCYMELINMEQHVTANSTGEVDFFASRYSKLTYIMENKEDGMTELISFGLGLGMGVLKLHGNQQSTPLISQVAVNYGPLVGRMLYGAVPACRRGSLFRLFFLAPLTGAVIRGSPAAAPYTACR